MIVNNLDKEIREDIRNRWAAFGFTDSSIDEKMEIIRKLLETDTSRNYFNSPEENEE